MAAPAIGTAVTGAARAAQRAGAGGQAAEENARAAIAAALAALGLSPLLLLLLVIAAFVAVIAAVGQVVNQTPAGTAGYPAQSGIPKVYWPVYTTAAEHYEVSPYVLASIHKHETGFSTHPSASSGVNFAGCCAGPMQFNVKAGTWDAYKNAFRPVKGARPDSYPLQRTELASCKGVPDDTGCVYDDFDAIAAAAHKLRRDGADHSLDSPGTTRALYRYNNSTAYVKGVLDKAREWERIGVAAIDVPVGSTAPRTIERVIAVANVIDRQTEAGQIPYCWGGGHGPKPGPSGGSYCWHGNTRVYGSTRQGLDCSGAVRWLLVQSGFRDPGGIGSGSYGSYLRSGRGRQVTFHYTWEHIWIEIDGRSWETSTSNLNHGPGWSGSRSGGNEGSVEGL